MTRKFNSENYFFRKFLAIIRKAHQATQFVAIFSKTKKQLAVNSVICLTHINYHKFNF